MTIREKRLILTPPEDVWAILEDPDLIPVWNPKCVRLDAGGNRMYAGLSYPMTFKWSGPEKECVCDVLECDPPRLLVIRQTLDAPPNPSYVTERFVLDERENGTATMLTHTVDLRHAGMPFWLRAVMWFFTTFGKPSGSSPLEGIKALAEHARQPQ